MRATLAGHAETRTNPGPEPCGPSNPLAGHPCGPRAGAARNARPRIIDSLAQAREFQRRIDAGEVKNAAELARTLHLTRARVSQILSLLRLAPEVLAYIANLKGNEGQMFLTAKMVLPLVRMSREEQVALLLQSWRGTRPSA